MSAAPRKYRQITARFSRYPVWDWDEDPVLEGIVTDLRTVKSGSWYRRKETRVMTVRQGEGYYTVWESAGLSGLMDEVDAGSEIKIVYEGIRDIGSGRRYKDFLCYVAEEEVV